MVLVPVKLSEAVKITDSIPLPGISLMSDRETERKAHGILPSYKPTICTIDSE